MKLLHSLLIFALLIVALPSHAQVVPQAADPNKFSSKELKKIEKSKALYQKGKYAKAIATIDAVQKTHLLNDELWMLRVEYEHTQYVASAYADAGKAFASENTAVYKNNFLLACSFATLYSNKQENAAIYLRTFLVDENVDENVSKDAKEEFQDGETAFFNEKYDAATKHYKNAYKLDTTYYKAALYIGDAYFRGKEYEEALPWYQKAVNMQPNMLEARKYLTDVYMKLRRWKEAYNACIDGIIVYPDAGMFGKLEVICEELDKKFDAHWMPRFYLPNSPAIEQAPIAEEPWNFYRNAKNEVKDNLDKKGQLTNKEGSLRFLEVYSWDKMLDRPLDGSVWSFPEKMRREGFLDCYVMVSMYHISFHDQYKVFARENKERIRKYIETYLVQ